MAIYDGSSARRAIKPSAEAGKTWLEHMVDKEIANLDLPRELVIIDAREHHMNDLDIMFSKFR